MPHRRTLEYFLYFTSKRVACGLIHCRKAPFSSTKLYIPVSAAHASACPFLLAVVLAKAHVVHGCSRAGSGVPYSPCLLALLVNEGNDLLERLSSGWRRCIPGHECLAFPLVQGQLHLPTNLRGPAWRGNAMRTTFPERRQAPGYALHRTTC